ncbi:MAG TPA: class IV adenylate cyclase [Candidatus Sulfopaludibacter sp.]|jgi:adenylate cyclase class 2|nr:class IV adenylate cyclase [Candidatus Sulfopaludibacter sp.]
MKKGTHETEIKLAVANVQTARRLLRAAGFRVFRRRVFESNVVFDTAGGTLRKNRTMVRVREAGSHATLTFKGVPIAGKHKSREELETEIASARTVSQILDRLGFLPSFRYEKYRAEYRAAGGSGVATLDETPIGVYIELEGSPRWIDRMARKLGFAESDYIVASYASLYLEWCKRRGVTPGFMVF